MRIPGLEELEKKIDEVSSCMAKLRKENEKPSWVMVIMLLKT